MKKSQIDRFFEITFLVLMLIIVIGTPLAFTSLTRSVFEVNKLLLLRLVSVITLSIWFFKYIFYKSNGFDNDSQQSISLLGFRWQKVGLEWIVLLWIGVNILSTVFSQNIKISIIGAYDRWEGIITVINYMILVYIFAKCTTKPRQIQWLFGGIIASTVVSAIYGVFQSLGYDFMNWSVDPTARVFACINNPVHYCAYVAMVVPVGLGWLIYISAKEQEMDTIPLSLDILKWFIFLSTMLIYYNQFLSYSRATWMGFIGAMTLFYIMVCKLLDSTNEKSYLTDFFITGISISTFYLITIFNLHHKSLFVLIAVLTTLTLYLIYSYWVTSQQHPSLKSPFSVVKTIATLLVGFLFLFNLYQLGFYVGAGIYIVLGISVFYWAWRLNPIYKPFFSRLIIILIFTKLQFIAISWTSIYLFVILTVTFYLISLRSNQDLNTEKKYWLIIFLIIFGGVIVLPTLPSHFSQLFQKENVSHLEAINNVQQKVQSYQDVAIEGTARTSMWKSAVPWFKDYWLIGSGLDTVKFMYPTYRRPDYGRLEGGHNFTPDRLHNEYINTLTTKGIIGFLVYYFGFILGWFFLIVGSAFRNRNHPNLYLISSLTAGVIIYLGQVMFNFGVVATLVLFYIFIGLALAIKNLSANES